MLKVIELKTLSLASKAGNKDTLLFIIIIEKQKQIFFPARALELIGHGDGAKIKQVSNIFSLSKLYFFM